MKHWDLYADETVTLRSSGGDQVKGRFLFRHTARACFLIEDGQGSEYFEEFLLTDGGGLRVAIGRDEYEAWTIQGEDRGTRYSFPPSEHRMEVLESRRSFQKRMGHPVRKFWSADDLTRLAKAFSG